MSRDRNSERNAKIVSLRRKGMWPTDIAKHLGVSRNIVIGVCFRAGLSGDNGWKETPRGEDHGRAKLTAQQVREIRARYVPYVVSAALLAREYGVHFQTVRDVVRGKTWAA